MHMYGPFDRRGAAGEGEVSGTGPSEFAGLNLDQVLGIGGMQAWGSPEMGP